MRDDVYVGGYEPIFDSDSPAEVLAAAQRWLNVSSAKAKVFVRMKENQPVSVSLLFGPSPAHIRPHLVFVPAENLGLRRQYEPPIFRRNGSTSHA